MLKKAVKLLKNCRIFQNPFFERRLADGQDFIQDFKWWVEFVVFYTKKKLKIFAFHFETGKGYLVEFLMIKRGRYSRPFLNLSLFVLVSAAVLGAPVIADSYPGVDKDIYEFSPPSSVLTSFSPDGLETATQISPKPRDKVISYKVSPGDTLSSIAEKFDVSIETILWANNLSKKAVLKPGQRLKIPPVTGIVHKVKAGETIYSIAKHYRTEPQKIVNFPFNEFLDLDTFALAVGQTLIVPDGIMPKAAPIKPKLPPIEFFAGGAGKLAWPTSGRITQYPVWYHMAVDIANKAAPGIGAAEKGKVVYAGCVRWGYGCHVIIDHGGGLSTLYGHLSSYYVKKGQFVSRGQVIGKMGSTGRSSGTHLHFEVRKAGRAVNPLPYLK